MRTLSTFVGTAAILMGLAGCVSSPEDILSTVTSATLTDTFGTSETGDPATGDGDGDATTTTGDGDGDATTTTGDGDGDAGCGSFNAPCCEGDVCDEGLECNAGVCELGGGDGDGDPTTGGPIEWGDGPYYGDPAGGCIMPDEIMLADGQLPVPGGHCSPIAMCADANCMNADACPPAPEGTTAVGGVAWTDGMGGNYCALICQFGADPDECPAGSTCKDLMQMGLGVCTYP